MNNIMMFVVIVTILLIFEKIRVRNKSFDNLYI